MLGRLLPMLTVPTSRASTLKASVGASTAHVDSSERNKLERIIPDVPPNIDATKVTNAADGGTQVAGLFAAPDRATDAGGRRNNHPSAPRRSIMDRGTAGLASNRRHAPAAFRPAGTLSRAPPAGRVSVVKH